MVSELKVINIQESMLKNAKANIYKEKCLKLIPPQIKKTKQNNSISPLACFIKSPALVFYIVEKLHSLLINYLDHFPGMPHIQNEAVFQ